VNRKKSLLLATISLVIGIRALIRAGAAWIADSCFGKTWLSCSNYLDASAQATVFWSLIILLGFSWLAVTIYKSVADWLQRFYSAEIDN
jgi:hypothetical protein